MMALMTNHQFYALDRKMLAEEASQCAGQEGE
jgi:hypothetical protein